MKEFRERTRSWRRVTSLRSHVMNDAVTIHEVLRPEIIAACFPIRDSAFKSRTAVSVVNNESFRLLAVGCETRRREFRDIRCRTRNGLLPINSALRRSCCGGVAITLAILRIQFGIVGKFRRQVSEIAEWWLSGLLEAAVIVRGTLEVAHARPRRLGRCKNIAVAALTEPARFKSERRASWPDYVSTAAASYVAQP